LCLRISHRIRNRFMFRHTGLSADPWKVIAQANEPGVNRYEGRRGCAVVRRG
jgi:hypothetical protein